MKRWMLRPVARCKNGCIGERVAPALVSLHEMALQQKLAALICLNLLDAVFTLWWVSLGLAEEANPVMALLLSKSPLSFMIGKIALVYISVFILLANYKSKIASLVASIAVYLYSCVAAYHFISLMFVLI